MTGTIVRTSWRAALGAALTASALGTGPAAAHEEGAPRIVVVERVRPATGLIEARGVPASAPLIAVRLRGTTPLVVLGEAGEPFARLDAAGVSLNLRSPTAYRSVDPLGRHPLPARAGPGAPEWHTVSAEASWQWFDPRLRGPIPARFVIPARLGTRPVRIEGRVERAGLHGHLEARLVEVRAPVPGVEVRVLPGPIPGIFVRNATGRLLEVPGRAGEPFLRIGPDGVEANTRSPTLYLASSQGVRDVPPEADARAAPAWERVSDRPVYAWLEYAARAELLGAQPDLGDRRTSVGRWITRATLDGAPVEVHGSVDWVPAARAGAAQGDPAWWRRPWTPAIPAAVAIAAIFRARRARRPRSVTS